jgi:type I restriction enzyme R subunit
MNAEPLDEKFKDSQDPLRLVFLCAMWLTGFDVPSCSTIYLDKPMRNHTLMQTIARANRVFPGKHSGVIVDYANVFASLERALAIYGKGRGGERPVRDKQALVEELRRAVAAATQFCKVRGVDLTKIEGASAEKFERAQAVEDGANRLLNPEAVKRDFLAHARLVDGLYGAVKPDPIAVEFAKRCGSIRALADYIRNCSDPPDISHVIQGINELLDRSIGAEPFKIKKPDSAYGAIDLSKIDFEKLAKRFEKKKPTSSDLERLKAAVKAQLERMVRLNRTRADYLEKFRELIDEYNNGSRNIEEIFKDLIALSRVLTEEQNRHVREHLSEEELTVFDILTRPGPELSTAEREEVKKVAHLLLERLHTLLVLGWRQKIQSRARVRLAIEDMLDAGLPRAYDKAMFENKSRVLFEHVYEAYLGEGRSVYSAGA